MSQPINLNKARKARARAVAQALAEQNRARFGRTKAEREAQAREAERAGRAVEAHKREPGD